MERFGSGKVISGVLRNLSPFASGTQLGQVKYLYLKKKKLEGKSLGWYLEINHVWITLGFH